MAFNALYTTTHGPLRLPLREMARGVEIMFSMLNGFRTPSVPVLASAPAEFLPSAEGDSRPHGPPVNHNPTPVIPERLRFLEALGPHQVIHGVKSVSGRAYVAFVFASVVVLESEKESNALYFFVRQDGWETLARMGKLDLLRQKPAGFLRRVVHQGDWQGRARKTIQVN